MGDRYFDLANFAVNNELDEAAARQRCSRTTSASGRSARGSPTLRLMRFMSDFREAMWGVVQAVVSELDFDFADYASKHFDAAARDRRRPRASPDWLEEARVRRELSCRTRPAA